MKSLFLRGPSLGVRLTLLASLSAVLMAVDYRSTQLDKVRSALSLVVHPLLYVVSLPADAYGWLNETLHTRGSLLADNARLREQNLLLKQRSQKYAALEAENRQLRELLDSSAEVDERVLLADLLSVDLDASSRQVVLDKGTRHGVFPGQGFVDADGVMGQVLHAGPVASTGMLVTDANHAMPVRINRTGVRGVAEGTGLDDRLRLSYVANTADVRRGDLVVSSGVGGAFPAGYPVGHVESVQAEAGEPFARITVRPSARLDRARQVLLVWTRAPAGMSPTRFRP